MERKTAGQLSLELAAKPHEAADSTEQMRECLTNWDSEFAITVERGKKVYATDFYIVVITKKERLMQNVLRNFFHHRSTCPTPEWDQAVYKYHISSDSSEFLWVIPAKDWCEYFTKNQRDIVPEQYELLRYVLDFNDGSLLRYAKELNGEETMSPLLVS